MAGCPDILHAEEGMRDGLQFDSSHIPAGANARDSDWAGQRSQEQRMFMFDRLDPSRDEAGIPAAEMVCEGAGKEPIVRGRPPEASEPRPADQHAEQAAAVPAKSRTVAR